jgi:glycosyltransferase involved in cell wall biosynthesis
MRILFALPGLHRYDRGAEIAFISVAKELAKLGHTVSLIGSGTEREGTPYRFLRAGSMSRETFRAFPSIPLLRNDCAYEELTFISGLARAYRPKEYDITLTCSYPFTNWLLRRPSLKGARPLHVFVTQNGDWPARSNRSEYRWFGCEGLICTNPDFFERNQAQWNCALIPNGVDCERFSPGPPQREAFVLPPDRPIVLMVSALIPTKRVDAGIDAVNRIPGAHLVVAGNGPDRDAIEAAATQRLPGRFTLLSVPADRMPDLYRSADVFLHLSKEESFGNVFLEAMACGLPIVAHDSPRTRWIVGDNQPLVDSDNLEAVSTAIRDAANTTGNARTEELTKASSFSWEKIGKMYEAFLKGIVA